MAYSLSSNIQIFPTTQRNIWDPLGKLTTEYNLTSILNKLLDVEGFVFTVNNTSSGDSIKKQPLTISTAHLDFNLNGYIIHLEGLSDLITTLQQGTPPITLQDGHKIFAGAKVETPSSGDEYEKSHFKYLSGYDTDIANDGDTNAVTEKKDGDTGDFYKGIVFTLTLDEPSSEITTAYPLQLPILEYHTSNNIEYGDDGWYIPKESQIKFKSSLGRTSISIDDGVI